MQQKRKLFLLVMLFVIGGLLIGVVGTEGADDHHQDAVNHCVTCCVNFRATVTPTQEGLRLVVSEDNGHLIEQSSFYQETIVRLLFRPPKHLA